MDGTASQFIWSDEGGVRHVIEQGDGGEQGDASIPGLFSLALRPALLSIQSRVREGEGVVAYLDDKVATLWKTCGINANQG